MRKSKVAFILLLISVVIASILSYLVKSGGGVAFDKAAVSLITTIFPEQTQSFFRLIAILGEELGIAIIGIAMILWLWFKNGNYWGMALILIGVAVGNELNGLIKELIKRPRPEFANILEADGFSFPSGHAMVGTILYIIVAYFIFQELKSVQGKWMVGVVFALIMLLVGASRIVLQAHYPSDVIAGFAMGYTWSYIIILAYEVFSRRKKASTTRTRNRLVTKNF